MILKLVNGLILAEGSPMELAMYSHTLLEIFKLKIDMEEEEHDREFMSRFKDISLSDLMSREMKNENEEEEHD